LFVLTLRGENAYKDYLKSIQQITIGLAVVLLDIFVNEKNPLYEKIKEQ
jgi:hypothetical protein